MPLDPGRTIADLDELRELTGDENGAQRVAWTDTWEQARAFLRAAVEATGARGADRRGGQPVVHAARRLRAGAADRRPHGFGAERRLARRLPQLPCGRGGPAPDRRGGDAAGHGATRLVGRRGGRALRAVALRLLGRRRLDGRPGGAAEARRPRRDRPAGCARGARRLARRCAWRRAPSWRTRPPISSCTSSRGPCSSRSICRSASCSARSASSARASPGAARRRTPARRRWTSAAMRSQARRSSRSTSGRSRPRSAAGRCARRAASSASPASSPRSSRRPSSCSTSGTSTRPSSPACSRWPRSRRSASPREENIEVEWERIWNIEPILFDEQLIELADESIREVAGTSHRLPSGPLHDAAEVSRAGVPTVMVFVQSLRGLSHTKLEDTKREHLALSVEALDRLASKTIAFLS